MSNQDEWSDNFLSEDQYFNHDTTANGITVNYNEEQRFMDVRVVDDNEVCVAEVLYLIINCSIN